MIHKQKRRKQYLVILPPARLFIFITCFYDALSLLISVSTDSIRSIS